MSEDTTQEADHVDMAAGKTAAKKTVRKTAVKAAVKAAAKAVRKTARKKANAGDAVNGSPEQMPLGLDGPKPRDVGRVESPRADRDSDRTPEARSGYEPRTPREDHGDSDGTRFGRVPGGGRVAREDGAEAATPHQEDLERRVREDRGEPRGEPRADHGDRVERVDRDRRKRRRKRRRDGRVDGRVDGPQGGDNRDRNRNRDGRENREPREPREARQGDESRESESVMTGPKFEVNGLFEMAPKGFGFLRVPGKNFEQARDDVFVSPDMVRKSGLRVGVWIHGQAQEGSRGPQLVEITTVNELPPEEARKLPAFEELKAINPCKRIAFETVQDRNTTRVVDLMSPVGRGQRGLIVSPPRSGKTTMLLHIAEAVRELHDETLHLMILLVDERPEEVTEFRRCLPGVEVYASSNDENARNHTRIAEICIERAKRLVEGGKHVFLLMDSITRLARAYNGGMRSAGRGIGSGGIMVGALEAPRRLFAAARNTREAGSLTILATALVQTNSRADDAIFQEFKGTGNMELVLDRKVAENYIYPAVDIFKSGTRREELLLPEHTLHKIHMIRRGLAGHRPAEAMERLLFFLKKFPNNPQMLLEIKG